MDFIPATIGGGRCWACKSGPNTEECPCKDKRHARKVKPNDPCGFYRYHFQPQVIAVKKHCTSCGRDLPSRRFDFSDELGGKICKNCMRYYRSATKEEQARLRDGR